MKFIVKTLTLALIGTLVLSSCSNSKATSSTTTTTKTKPSYDAQAKDSKTKKAVAVKVDPKRVGVISPTMSKKALTTTKSVENNVRK